MKISLNVTVNRAPCSHEVEPRLLLAHYLRDVLGLTGTHVGCDTSQCGACTVDVDGLAVKSCTLFAVQTEGREVTTIEGISGRDDLLAIQEAFKECHAIQCGFCTPGLVIAARQLLARYPNPSEAQVRQQIDGNVCRCTGYHNIVKAIRLTAARAAESSGA